MLERVHGLAPVASLPQGIVGCSDADTDVLPEDDGVTGGVCVLLRVHGLPPVMSLPHGIDGLGVPVAATVVLAEPVPLGEHGAPDPSTQGAEGAAERDGEAEVLPENEEDG